jgi:hypothetical protein
MLSTRAKTSMRGVARVLAATMALTVIYILLQEVLVDVVSILYPSFSRVMVSQSALAQEAREVARASAAREAQLTPKHALVAWVLGLRLGGAAQFLAEFALKNTALRQQARAVLAPRLRAAQELADFLGIGPVYPLDSSSLAQSSRTGLAARIEADEGRIGARIAERTTLRHQHLYMLAMHVGVAVAAMQRENWQRDDPPVAQIMRHATLAGLKREDWEPLARLPRGTTRAEIAAKYEAAVSTLQQKIAAGAGRAQ